MNYQVKWFILLIVLICSALCWFQIGVQYQKEKVVTKQLDEIENRYN